MGKRFTLLNAFLAGASRYRLATSCSALPPSMLSSFQIDYATCCSPKIDGAPPQPGAVTESVPSLRAGSHIHPDP